MTQEVLYSGQITGEVFQKLLTACQRANMFSEALILVERFPAYVISSAEERRNLLLFTRSTSDLLWVTVYTTGRIFNEHMELRWEKNGEDAQIVYVGIEDYRSILSDYELDLLKVNVERSGKMVEVEVDQLARRKKHYFLFGERLLQEDLVKIGPPARPGDFAEIRIPRLLRYPPPDNDKQVPDGRYMRMNVREYSDDAGDIVLYRFLGLEAVEG